MGKEQFNWHMSGKCGHQTLEKDGVKGDYQSPINIVTRKAEYDPKLDENDLVIEYYENSCKEIKNTGHTFQVDGYKNNPSKIRGGPLKHEYNFLQFHMHWGDSLDHGSEHYVDGLSYSAELHFVNWNHELYEDPSSASGSNNHIGLSVLGVFVKIGKFNEEFDKIATHLYDIHLKNEHKHIANINIMKLLPENKNDYWTYSGSLTTPPFSECVQWIVFREPIEMTVEQLDKCHQLYEATKEELCNYHTLIRYNDRPLCSLCNRVVYKSFEH